MKKPTNTGFKVLFKVLSFAIFNLREKSWCFVKMFLFILHASPRNHKGQAEEGETRWWEHSVLVVSQSLGVSAVQRAAVSDKDVIISFNTVGAVVTNLN